MLDLTGERFGRLTVLSRNYEKQRQIKGNRSHWNCVCSCGNTVVVSADNLRRGLSTSCGCYQKERSSNVMAKAKIKKCRYKNCSHESDIINIDIDEYRVESNRYYHADCWASKQQEDQKQLEELRQKKAVKPHKKDIDEKTKNDIKLIQNIWVKHINQTVVYSNLRKVLNEFLDRGIDSDYLVFTVQYCVTHKLNLNYPQGLSYFLDRSEIKEAYAQKQRRKQSENAVFKIPTSTENNEPKIKLKQKPSGFDKLLGGG